METNGENGLKRRSSALHVLGVKVQLFYYCECVRVICAK